MRGILLTPAQLDRLSVFAFLHDIGKCNYGFQRRQDQESRQTAGHTAEVAALLFCPDLKARFESAIGLADFCGWTDPEVGVLELLIAAVSHHGQPAFTHDADYWGVQPCWLGDRYYDPVGALRKLGQRVREMFPAAFREASSRIQVTPQFQQVFAGLVMLADWLGSHCGFFPYTHEGADRIVWARDRAHRALATVGLDTSVSRAVLGSREISFSEVFGFSPNALQARLSDSGLPALLIAESETGSGKTEAALSHFLTLFRAGQVDSLYFALPTRVAAREIYGRVRKFAERAFGAATPPVVLAVPGYARVDGEPVTCLPPDSRRCHDAIEQQERAWAAERPKRFLSAPIAVGTIDQALLSALAVPHAHLRAACLNRSLLVVDEVHASDTYMRYLLRHLLRRHIELGGRALLLSATLGSVARAEFLTPAAESPEVPRLAVAMNASYPCLCASGKDSEAIASSSRRRKFVRLEPVPLLEAPERFRLLFPRLRKALESGMRVLVIVNTVARAVALQRIIESGSIPSGFLFRCGVDRGEGVICPHHGRYAAADREVMDAAVGERLGKHATPGSLLLIGTQTLEQSLDIGADWLIADLCPMDVLLQRLGRLQRHGWASREEALCTVLVPKETSFESWIGKRGAIQGKAGLGRVYPDLRVIQLTRDLIGRGRTIELPRQNRELVEGATHPDALGTLEGPAWRTHADSLLGKGTAEEMMAHRALLPDARFGQMRFPELRSEWVTRMGLKDRTLRLGSGYRSPFGAEVDQITVPEHLCPDTEATEPTEIEVVGVGLRFSYGPARFAYTRFGLERLMRGSS